jgi:hypothetical protein
MVHLSMFSLKVLEHEAYCVTVQSSSLAEGLRASRQR